MDEKTNGLFSESELKQLIDEGKADDQSDIIECADGGSSSAGAAAAGAIGGF